MPVHHACFVGKQEQLVDFTQSDLTFTFFIIFASMLVDLMMQIIQAKIVFESKNPILNSKMFILVMLKIKIRAGVPYNSTAINALPTTRLLCRSLRHLVSQSFPNMDKLDKIYISFYILMMATCLEKYYLGIECSPVPVYEVSFRNCMLRFLGNSFWALNYVFSVQI